MGDINDYLVNKIFTVPYIDKLIESKIAPDSFIRCVKRYEKKNDITYGKAISEIYHYLDKNYRNEYFFKNTIFNKLLLDKHNLYSTSALTELPIGESKVDLVMINGKGIAYEIKTDLDNFNRLPTQISDYYKLFCYVNIVVGAKNYKRAKEFLMDAPVGIYVLYDNGNLLCRKRAVYYNEGLSYDAIFNVLRKKEFESIILKHYGRLPNVNSFKYYRECLAWIKKINIKTFQKEAMDVLKKRTLLVINEVEKKFEDVVPYELSFYTYFTKKNRINYNKISEFWNKRMEM